MNISFLNEKPIHIFNELKLKGPHVKEEKKPVEVKGKQNRLKFQDNSKFHMINRDAPTLLSPRHISMLPHTDQKTPLYSINLPHPPHKYACKSENLTCYYPLCKYQSFIFYKYIVIYKCFYHFFHFLVQKYCLQIEKNYMLRDFHRSCGKYDTFMRLLRSSKRV